MKKETITKSLIGFLVFLSFFIYNKLQVVPLQLLGIDYSTMSLLSRIVYSLIYEFTYIIILLLIFNKTIEKDFKDYVKNFKSYIKTYMEYWAVSFGLMIIANLCIVTLFPNSVATNQEAVNNLFAIAPVYIIISSVIFAPIVEELVFRLSFRYMFNNDKLFILTSGLVFGAMHVVGTFNNFIDLIYIIPYSIPGFVFAYTLVKSKNIFVPMSLHFFHNGFMMLLQTILMFLV